MAIELTQTAIDSISAYCKTAYPHECCGALIGCIGVQAKKIASIHELTNSEPNSPNRRFMIDPAELNALDQRCRTEGYDVVGFYHSHPDCPANPSQTDLEYAWPEYSYIILRVDGGEVADIRSYELDSANNFESFVEESIHLL